MHTASGALMTARELPNLVYIGDVPVEASYHGSALLYRLLQAYPPERLLILESDMLGSATERRLPGVPYREFSLGCNRLLKTRFHSLVSAWLNLSAKRRAALLPTILNEFTPQAVLTVGHGFSWLTAAAFALQNQLALHLIVHDDWPRAVQWGVHAQRWLEKVFGRVYRQAASRLCISPAMAQEYRHRYGVKGTVLYPSRSAGVVAFSAPPDHDANPERPLIYAFGGSINSPGCMQALRELSAVLQRQGGQFNIYGPLTQLEADRAGLPETIVKVCGLLPCGEFIQELRDHVDVLFLPMSFAPEERSNMRLCFPSKLADYTVVGLPLLIYGPENCAAARWAQEQPVIAEVVTEQSENGLGLAIGRLRNPVYRHQLGQAALRTGNRYFGPAAAQQQFYAAISSSFNRAGQHSGAVTDDTA